MPKKGCKQLIFIYGGARSGKSDFAQDLAARLSSRVTFVATAQALDEEMERRIANHRLARPEHWQTIEAPLKPSQAIREHGQQAEVIVLDCLALLVSNSILSVPEEQQSCEAAGKLKEEIDALLQTYEKIPGTLLVVSNEVGQGVVPPYPLGRLFRDLLGSTNKTFAARADEVYWLTAGLPIEIKASGLAGVRIEE